MIKTNNQNNDIKELQKLNQPHEGSKVLRLSDDNLVIDVENVEKIYTTNSLVTRILKGVSLKIYQGEFVVVLGPSGSGKTTLMNIISGLDRATKGKVNVLGSNLINMNDDQLTVFRRINIGYIFQQYGLIPNLKVKENVEVGLYLKERNLKELSKNKNNEIKEIDESINKLKESLNNNESINSKNKDNLILEDFYNFVLHTTNYSFNIYNWSEIIDYCTISWSYNKIEGLCYDFNVFDNMYTSNLYYVFLNSNKNDLCQYVEQYRQSWINQVNDRFQKEINKDSETDINKILSTLGIEKIANKYPNQLSGGQQQRVSIARSFAKNPSILFADEPTGAVDLEMTDVILKAFKEINTKYNTTIIIVTHNPDIAKLATKVVYFKDGHIENIIEQTPINYY